MVFKFKKIYIASAIFNVFIVICFSILAVHCSVKYYALHKVISEQNENITEQSKKIDGLRNIVLGKLIFFYLNVDFI